MKNLTVAANVFSQYIRPCAFDRPICEEPGIEIDLLLRIARHFNANLNLLHADGWGYGSNMSALRLIQDGLADTTQSQLFTNRTTHDFRTSWPLFYAAAYPIIKAPSIFKITTYDLSESFRSYVWLCIIGSWVVCYALKKLSHIDAIQHFPIKRVSSLPICMFFILISLLLNLFSNNLSITLAYPAQPHLPFTTWNQLRSLLLTREFTFVDVSENNFYLSLLNLQDIASKIKIKRIPRGREVAVAKMVSKDPTLISMALLNKVTGANILEPVPIRLCRKLIAVRHHSFPVHKFGYLFNKQHPSWLLEKLNYSASSALFGTFAQQILRFEARHKGQFCFQTSKIEKKSQSIDEISISKSSGMFVVLGFGLGSSLLVLIFERILSLCKSSIKKRGNLWDPKVRSRRGMGHCWLPGETK